MRLGKHRVWRLMHHDATWRQEFQQTRSSLLQSCDGWVTRVEHIGSTAIAGLIARPTIDVIAGVDDLDGLTAAAMLIEGLNYRRIDPPVWAGDSITLQKPRIIRHPDSIPTHLVFLMGNRSKAFSTCDSDPRPSACSRGSSDSIRRNQGRPMAQRWRTSANDTKRTSQSISLTW